MDKSLKRPFEFESDSTDRIFDFAFSESPSALSTPELDYSPSSKRFRSDFPTFDDSLDPVSSPEDTSDLFNLFTPPLSATNSLELLEFPFDAPVITSDVDSAVAMFGKSTDDEGMTADDEAKSVLAAAPLFPPMQAASFLPATSYPADAPAAGEWHEHAAIPQPAVASRPSPSASPVLPKQHRLHSFHGPSPLSHSSTPSSSSAAAAGASANADALLEQYLDVNNVIDNTIALSNAKFWIDRYMTIPICGYLNRVTAERALQYDTPMPATTVAGISKPIKQSSANPKIPTSNGAAQAQMNNSNSNYRRRNVSSLKRTASAPTVYGLKRRSFFMGKGKEMVGLGVMVGDMLL
ncbi:hypothetical protein BZA70DRAFT_192572 [Myxozyma melibiosi]|uniref:Uncharacterized protein n=1 Tax=Myxozyma melibiosi TaxID=54550 RepID=A0ABR1F3J7_9ASCO